MEQHPQTPRESRSRSQTVTMEGGDRLLTTKVVRPIHCGRHLPEVCKWSPAKAQAYPGQGSHFNDL